MPEYLTQNEAFMKCKKGGNFIVMEEVDTEKIQSTLNIANADVEAANSVKNGVV